MGMLKYIERFRRMNDLIHRKATGNAEEFASALEISVSVLKDNLNDMRSLGLEIEFCRTRKTYFYKNNQRLLIKFEQYRMEARESAKVKGGAGRFSESILRTVLPDGSHLFLPLQHMEASAMALPRIPKSA